MAEGKTTQVVGFEDGLWKSARWERDCVLEETTQEIVCRVSEGETLRKICKSRGWPYSIVAPWVVANINSEYEAALAVWGDALAQESLEIADNLEGDVGRSKLQIDIRMKLASRWNRQRYGETPQINVTAQAGSLISILSSLPPVQAPELDVSEEPSE